MDQSDPHVAVIGAGISGLTAGKMLKDYGVRYTTFETSDRIGGNWAFGNPNGHSSAYRSLHIDTSKHRLSFKDFPMPEHYPSFPHHSQVKSYLDEYAEAFGLLADIEFGNGVVHAARAADGGWRIRDQAGADRHFDLLVVANGHHWDPRLPEFPGSFAGESMHSHSYIDPTHASGVERSAHPGRRDRQQRRRHHRRTVLESIAQRGHALHPVVRLDRPEVHRGQARRHVLADVAVSAAALATQGRANGRAMLGTDPTMYGLPPADHKLFEAHPTQSVELPLRLGSGDVTPKPNVARLDGHTVHFVDGTSAEFDVIIYATGYNITFPFFDPGFISAPDNAIRLYKRIFKPGIDDLAFIGFAQSVPTLFPFVECQSRLLAAYAVGRYALPPVDEMERTIEADQQLHSGHCTDRPRHTQQVDYFIYEHDLRRREIPGGHRAGAPAAAVAR